MTKRILIGEITTVHGIKGLVKVRSYVEDNDLFETDALFTDEDSNKTISLSLKSALKGDWLAEIKNVTDRNVAETYRGTKLYIDRDTLPDTDDGEFYIEDLKGMKVIDREGNTLGTILSVENFGASDLLDIKPDKGGNSFYIPYTEDFILETDMDNKIVKINTFEEV